MDHNPQLEITLDLSGRVIRHRAPNVVGDVIRTIPDTSEIAPFRTFRIDRWLAALDRDETSEDV